MRASPSREETCAREGGMGEIQRLTDPRSGKNVPGTLEARLSSAQVLSRLHPHGSICARGLPLCSGGSGFSTCTSENEMRREPGSLCGWRLDAWACASCVQGSIHVPFHSSHWSAGANLDFQLQKPGNFLCCFGQGGAFFHSQV